MSRLTVSRIPAAQGLAWLKQGWDLFKFAPIPWAGMTALVFLVLMGVGKLPFVGGFLVHALSPFIVAGFLAASRAGQAGEPVTFLYLGAGLQQGRNGLFILGLVYMLANMLVFRAMAFFTGGDLDALMAQMANPHDLTPKEAEDLLQGVMPGVALGSLLMVPLLMATWFSPALVLFEGFQPGKAVWWSFWACGVNWRPLFVYSSLLGLAGMLAVVIPFGLGLLVFIPLTLTSTYIAYRDVFSPVEDETRA